MLDNHISIMIIVYLPLERKMDAFFRQNHSGCVGTLWYFMLIAFLIILHIYSGTGLTEVVFEGGSANATKELKPHWLAEKAFILGHSKAWYNNKEILPSIVWYEFLIKIVPGRVSFRANNVLQAPLQWQFVGSNDETCDRFSCWTVLCEDLSGTVYPNAKWTKYCDVDEKITTEFRCLGIAVLNTRTTDSSAALKDVRMWKKSKSNGVDN